MRVDLNDDDAHEVRKALRLLQDYYRNVDERVKALELTGIIRRFDGAGPVYTHSRDGVPLAQMSVYEMRAGDVVVWHGLRIVLDVPGRTVLGATEWERKVWHGHVDADLSYPQDVSGGQDTMYTVERKVSAS